MSATVPGNSVVSSPDESELLKFDQVEVKLYVGELVRLFERKVA